MSSFSHSGRTPIQTFLCLPTLARSMRPWSRFLSPVSFCNAYPRKSCCREYARRAVVNRSELFAIYAGVVLIVLRPLHDLPVLHPEHADAVPVLDLKAREVVDVL